MDDIAIYFKIYIGIWIMLLPALMIIIRYVSINTPIMRMTVLFIATAAAMGTLILLMGATFQSIEKVKVRLTDQQNEIMNTLLTLRSTVDSLAKNKVS
jgi:hypothetical protein